jgi:hypothetical protein
MHLTRSAILAAAVLALCAGSASARPHERAEDFFTLNYDGRMPACDDGTSLYEISQRFATAEAFTFSSPLRMAAFTDIRQSGFRPNGPDFIPRRYCTAKVVFNDHSVRTMKYFIVESGGFMGFNRGVQFCVLGLDRYRAFSPDCDAAGP